jgi:hypothetical protein
MFKLHKIINPEIRNIWFYIALFILLGILLVASFCTQIINWKISTAENLFNYLNTLGSLLLVAGASFCSGGLTGFLFGVPRMLQNGNLLADSEQKRVITQNDNLVQISDWLTKIIVGVGLTQLYNIPTYIKHIGTQLSYTFGTDINKGSNAAIVTILYFVVAGFFSVYLWTRVYFTRMLNELEKVLDDQLKQDVEILKKVNNELQENSTDVGGGKNITSADIRTKLSEALTNQSNPTEPEYFDDPQKNKWGGQAARNGRIMTATVMPSSVKEFYRVEIKVISTDPSRPLTGFVLFHLHDTFRNPDPVIAVQNGSAILKLNMVYGAFTVGAEADNGYTQLELDLAELPNAPEEFRSR